MNPNLVFVNPAREVFCISFFVSTNLKNKYNGDRIAAK